MAEIERNLLFPERDFIASPPLPYLRLPYPSKQKRCAKVKRGLGQTGVWSASRSMARRCGDRLFPTNQTNQSRTEFAGFRDFCI